jgi:hypothetical protein
MDALAAKLDSKLREWKPETTEEVRALVDEIMGLADNANPASETPEASAN